MLLRSTRDTREHTDSYYAASANWRTDHPALHGDVHADVAIVGGGFSGVATALELSERGYKVVLLEANRIGWGASGRNGGQVIGGVGNHPEAFRPSIGADGVDAVNRMGFECVDIIRERVAKYAIDCDLTWGYCDVALKPRHMDEFRQDIEHKAQIGAPFETTLLDRDELRRYVNSASYCGGTYHTGWGHLQPLNLCLGEARAAEALGTMIYEQSRVLRITYGDNPVVYTEAGAVRADYVVLCGNAYLDDLVPRLAARVVPATSCIIATEPLSDEQLQRTLPANVAVCDPRTALDYYRRSADGRLLFGGRANYSGLEPADLVGSMRRQMLRIFPALREVKIDYGWSGQLGISLRRMPQMGRLDGNVLYVQAYSGHGVAPTHVMGRVLAEAIDGDTTRFDIMAKMKHPPFPGGDLLRRPMMALGMLYHKMLDAL